VVSSCINTASMPRVDHELDAQDSQTRPAIQVGDGMALEKRISESEGHAGAVSPVMTSEDVQGCRRVTIAVVDRPLGAVLDYLSRVGEAGVVCVGPSLRDLKTTIRMEHVGWRDAIDILAAKHGLEVKESSSQPPLLILVPPNLTPPVSEISVSSIRRLIEREDGTVVCVTIPPGRSGIDLFKERQRLEKAHPLRLPAGTPEHKVTQVISGDRTVLDSGQTVKLVGVECAAPGDKTATLG
jgi:hypothetical protein